MKTTYLILVLTASSYACFSQELHDGFYLSVDCLVNAEIKRTNTLNPKDEVCLSPQPFIAFKEIESITKLETANGSKFFDIVISEEASNQINSANGSLKTLRIALVIENKIALILNNKNPIQRVIRIVTTSHGARIKRVHKKISSHLQQQTSNN